MTTAHLWKSITSKNDEFYTNYEDIEKEILYYKDFLKDKIVYCNCDSYKSNFFKYFYNNFHTLGLKKLYTTNYNLNGDTPIKQVYDGTNLKTTPLKENGDFRSSECIDLLKKVDIIITNPPFSLIRKYVEILLENNKLFLIIAPLNMLHYRVIFNLIKNNKINTGFTFPHFSSPCIWLNNLKINKNKPFLELVKIYNVVDYPKYENYEAINVNKVTDIPIDYYDIIGVPCTYLLKHNPDQFEILGYGSNPSWSLNECYFFKKTIIYDKKGRNRATSPYIIKNGVPKFLYERIFIRRKTNLA